MFYLITCFDFGVLSRLLAGCIVTLNVACFALGMSVVWLAFAFV